MNNYFRQLAFFLTVISFLFLGNVSLADEAAIQTNPQYTINLDKATIAKGYTVSAFNNTLKLSLVPGILKDNTGVTVQKLDEEMPVPWQMERISGIYQFEFNNKSAYDNAKPFYIQFSYDELSNNYKQVYFYDKNYSTWRPLPTRDYPKEKFVRSLIHLPFARIAVFSNPSILSIGQASWYSYKNGNFAASPDFPKGSVIRVHNPENSKFVDVTINDYGPNRNLHPGRVLDLDKAAFKKIADLSEGTVNIEIEPLTVVSEKGQVLGVSEQGAETEPSINSKASIVMVEDDGEIIWQRNATATLPLASLTKLVAIKVYLDTNPDLNAVVAYDTQDEKYNYQYCKEWESARVRLNNGETLTTGDLLHAALVGSANNAVESLVRVSGLSREEFIKQMNETVKNWGTTNTSFAEPTGLSPDNVSSALDYAIITKEVFKNPIIQKASVMRSYEFTTVNTKQYHKFNNTNKLILANDFDITGSKTGYLVEAGYCLMTRVKSGGKNLIVVVMGSSDRDQSFNESEELINYGILKNAN